MPLVVVLSSEDWIGTSLAAEVKEVLIRGRYAVRLGTTLAEFVDGPVPRVGVVARLPEFVGTLVLAKNGGVSMPPLISLRCEPDAGVARAVYANLDVAQIHSDLLRVVTRALIDQILTNVRMLFSAHPVLRAHPQVQWALLVASTTSCDSVFGMARSVGCGRRHLERQWQVASRQLAGSHSLRPLPQPKRLVQVFRFLRITAYWLDEGGPRPRWSLVAHRAGMARRSLDDLVRQVTGVSAAALAIRDIPPLLMCLEDELMAPLTLQL